MQEIKYQDIKNSGKVRGKGRKVSKLCHEWEIRPKFAALKRASRQGEEEVTEKVTGSVHRCERTFPQKPSSGNRWKLVHSNQSTSLRQSAGKQKGKCSKASYVFTKLCTLRTSANLHCGAPKHSERGESLPNLVVWEGQNWVRDTPVFLAENHIRGRRTWN